MNASQRVRTIRLIEKLKLNPECAEELGIEVDIESEKIGRKADG